MIAFLIIFKFFYLYCRILGIDFDIRQGGVMYSRTKDINYFTGNAIQTAYNDRNPLIVPNSVNKIVNVLIVIIHVLNVVRIIGHHDLSILQNNLSFLFFFKTRTNKDMNKNKPFEIITIFK